MPLTVRKELEGQELISCSSCHSEAVIGAYDVTARCRHAVIGVMCFTSHRLTCDMYWEPDSHAVAGQRPTGYHAAFLVLSSSYRRRYPLPCSPVSASYKRLGIAVGGRSWRGRETPVRKGPGGQVHLQAVPAGSRDPTFG